MKKLMTGMLTASALVSGAVIGEEMKSYVISL